MYISYSGGKNLIHLIMKIRTCINSYIITSSFLLIACMCNHSAFIYRQCWNFYSSKTQVRLNAPACNAWAIIKSDEINIFNISISFISIEILNGINVCIFVSDDQSFRLSIISSFNTLNLYHTIWLMLSGNALFKKRDIYFICKHLLRYCNWRTGSHRGSVS